MTEITKRIYSKIKIRYLIMMVMSMKFYPKKVIPTSTIKKIKIANQKIVFQTMAIQKILIIPINILKKAKTLTIKITRA